MAKEKNTVYGRTSAAKTATVDEGLRAYMLGVYNMMALGLALTGLVAYFVATTPALAQLFLGTPLRWVMLFAPLGIVLFFSFRIHTLSASAAQALFWAYAGLMGISMAGIFLIFTGQSIARVFFITAATFGGMSLYGYTTQRDLTAFGSFLFMGLIGIVVASLVNMFLQSSAMQFVISVIGVLVFTGLTAYDTQQIKESYYANVMGDAKKLAIVGALRLYLDFLNLFISLLYLFGERR